jgi:hypothetical protein
MNQKEYIPENPFDDFLLNYWYFKYLEYCGIKEPDNRNISEMIFDARYHPKPLKSRKRH